MRRLAFGSFAAVAIALLALGCSTFKTPTEPTPSSSVIGFATILTSTAPRCFELCRLFVRTGRKRVLPIAFRPGPFENVLYEPIDRHYTYGPSIGQRD